MRVLKIILLSLAGLVAVLLAAVAGLNLYLSIDREDTFVLEQAAFEDPDYLGRLAAMGERAGFQDFHAGVHRLTRGKGTIFAYRYYSNGSPDLIDDEWYKKVSVWIPGPTPSNETTIGLSGRKQALLVFSHGGSAFPTGGCSGYGTSGTVHIVPNGPNYVVTIAADVTPVGNPDYRGCKNERVELSFRAGRMRFEKLTPWLGLRGDHPYDETYRR